MFTRDDLIVLQNYVTGLKSRYKNGFEVREDSAKLDSGEESTLNKLSRYYKEKGGTPIAKDEFYLYELRENVYKSADNWLFKIYEDIKLIDDEVRAQLFDRTTISNMTGQQLQDVLLDTLEKANRKGWI